MLVYAIACCVFLIGFMSIYLFSNKSTLLILDSRVTPWTKESVDDTLVENDLEKWKDLYHKLQTLEDHPDVLPRARQVLLSFLRDGLLIENYKAPQRSILHIETYDKEALNEFLMAEAQDTFEQWELYTKRRAAGSPSDLFRDREHAREWLKDYAPLNLIDGAWICRVHKITTPFALRRVTKHVWQILSEELGDGDLEKNHIFIYRELLRDIGVELPPTHDPSFTHDRHGMKDPQIWKAGLAQLLISLFPNDFLPEILGFNLHFERLSNQTLKASKELPEYGISGQYYSLHISIDNGHSGHSAMALATVNQYLEHVSETNSEAVQETWKRIQSGYLLSQSLDAKETVKKFERKVADVLSNKAQLSRQIHCASRVRIGKQSLADWLASHNERSDGEWKAEFLNALANARPWIAKGDSVRSRLVRELSWKGKMFGAFTNSEVRLVRAWIDSLVPEDVPEDTKYWQMVSHRCSSEERHQDNIIDHPVFSRIVVPDCRLRQEPFFTAREPIDASRLHIRALFPLWFAHVSLLENVVNSPYRTSNKLTSYMIQVLHAEMGYELHTTGVGGMDELLADSNPDLVAIGVQMMLHHGLPEPVCLKDVLSNANDDVNTVKFSHCILDWSMQPIRNEAFLLGLARAFLDFETAVLSRSDLVPSKAKFALRQIVQRKQHCFVLCLEELQEHRYQFGRLLDGYDLGREELQKCLL